MAKENYLFGPFRLNPPDRSLWRDVQIVSVTAKEFDVLHALLCRAGKPVDKTTLLQEIWPENPGISENNLFQQIRALRKKLGQDSAGREYIRNIPNGGYFVPGVTIETFAPQPAGTRTEFSRVSLLWLLVLGLLLAAFLTASKQAAYGFAIVVACISCLIAAGIYSRAKDSVLSRGGLAFLLIAVMAYIPSAATLAQVVSSVINCTTIRPAVVYPFVTGLKFLPLFVVVLAFWVLLATNDDAGFRRRQNLKRAYLVLAPIVLLLTVVFLVIGSGDDRIWREALPGSRPLAGGYLVIFLLNVFVWLAGYRHFSQEQITSFRKVFSSLVLAYPPLALTSFLIDAQYNVINSRYLDQRRPDAYRVSNPEALVQFRKAENENAEDVGPDLRSLLEDPSFERTVRTQPFYKQDFDEWFQINHRSLMFGFRSSGGNPGDSANFVIVRFPEKIALALRFQPIAAR